MNKNILILSVLMALSPMAFANASDQAAPKVEKPTVVAPTPAAAPATAPDTSKKEDVNMVRVDGRDIIKNSDGTLAAYICETGMDCRKQVLTTKEISDTAAISKEIQAALEKSKKQTEVKKEELNKKEYTSELIADLEESILDECDIETKSSRLRDRDDDLDTDRPSWSRVRSRNRADTSRSSVANSGRFTHAQSNETSESSECAADALQSKLEELSLGFDDDLADLGLDEGDLNDLSLIMKNLNKEIKKEKDPEKKAALELALSKVKALNDKVKITQNITQRFVRSNVLTRFENDLASRAGYGDTYLHEIAAGTPDLFSGVRKDAAVSILEVYKKQIKSYISLRDAGNLQESTRIGRLATGYNAYMVHPQQNGKSAGQNFMEQFALDSDLSPRPIVQDVYNVYSPASAEIQNYLTTTAVGGAQSKSVPLPGVLATDSTSLRTEADLTSAGRLQPSNHMIGRAQRIQNNGVTQQQGRASVPAPNGPPRGGMRQGF